METNKPNIFYINRSEIEGQLNPSLYKERFYFKSDIFPIKRISEIAYINPNTSFNKLRDNDVVSFVPMESIDEENGIISKKYFKPISETKGFTRFLENDLIWAKITPCMQNGKSAIVRNTLNNFACGSTEFFIIRPKNENVLVEYLHFILRDERVLNVAKNYFGGSAGQQRVSKDFLLNYKIPLPPKEIQQIIVDNINQAYQLKQEKEKEAKRLLDSIDDYLLGELGITLPEIDNSLENRVFISSFKEVTGNRLDPFAALYLGENSKSNIYKNERLKNIANIKKGQSITKEKITEGLFPVIAGGQSIPYYHNQYNNESNVITVSASGAYSGFVWYHDYKIFASDCSVIRSKDENEYRTKYIFEVLKALQKEIYMLQQGAGQPHVYSDDLAKIFIPQLGITKQDELIEHISEIRDEAKRMQLEAKDILEKAKLEVERMILGE